MEGSSTLGRLGFEGLFDVLVLQLYSLVDHFGLKDYKEVFMLSTLVFLFNNTSRCYLVFVSLFPYSLLGMAMGRGGAEGWDLRPLPTWIFFAPTPPRPV